MRSWNKPWNQPVKPVVSGNDPRSGDLPQRTDWNPLVRGGANFRTHSMLEASPGVYEIRGTFGLKLFGAIFFAGGLGMLVFGALNVSDSGERMILGAIGSVFALVGALIVYTANGKRVIDTRYGRYYKISPLGSESSPAETVSLERVGGIQIIAEYVHSSGKNSSNYYSYELNFVLKDGSRLNIMDHGHARSIREHAETLGQLLGVPVWDSSRQ